MVRFFTLIAENRIKVRIMFTHEFRVPQGLGRHHRRHRYHLLYYQFIKHAFGLAYSNNETVPISLRIYLDRMPGKKANREKFKRFLVSLQQQPEFRAGRIIINEEQVAEVESHDHVLLQCLDVVLGSIQFRLNDHHKGGSGRRTVAKLQLYKAIHKLICGIYPNFNIGITTGTRGDVANRWHHPYRHWKFERENSGFRRDKKKT